MTIIHPFEEPPAPGTMTEVAPGIFWSRLPLPFRLDHVNVYFIEDGDGVSGFRKCVCGGGSDAACGSSDQGNFHKISVSKITARLSPVFTEGQVRRTMTRPEWSVKISCEDVPAGSVTLPRVWARSTVCPSSTLVSKYPSAGLGWQIHSRYTRTG